MQAGHGLRSLIFLLSSHNTNTKPRLIGRQISSSLAETNWLPNAAVRNAPARTLLTVIDKNPAAVLTALNPAVGSSKHTTGRVSRHEKRRTSRGVTKLKTYFAEDRRKITK